MPNRCVAAGCGSMPSDSVSLFRFPKEPHLCDLWTRQVQRTRANWKPTSASVLCSEHFSVDCFNDIPSLKASLGFAVQRKRVLKSTAVPSIFKRSDHVPEKKARKSTAVEKLAAKTAEKCCKRPVECFDIDCTHNALGEKCRFYKWPTDEASLTKWQIALDRRPDCVRDRNSRMCSCHFEKGLKANGPTIFFKSTKKDSIKVPKLNHRKIVASLPVILPSSLHCGNHMANAFTTGTTLLPVSPTSAMGANQQEETVSQIQYYDSAYTSADHTNSAQIAMDNGYTISVKTEEEKSDLLTGETLQIIEPRHWTVNDRGILVNADEHEVMVKVEKPDWTIENVIADSSTTLTGQGVGDSKDGILIVKEEGAVCSDPLEISVCETENSDDIKHTCTVATVCGTEFRLLDKLHVPAGGKPEIRPYAGTACGNKYSTTVHKRSHSKGDITCAASVEDPSQSPEFIMLSYHEWHHTE